MLQSHFPYRETEIKVDQAPVMESYVPGKHKNEYKIFLSIIIISYLQMAFWTLSHKLVLIDVTVESSKLDTLFSRSPSVSLRSESATKAHARPISEVCFNCVSLQGFWGFLFFFFYLNVVWFRKNVEICLWEIIGIPTREKGDKYHRLPFFMPASVPLHLPGFSPSISSGRKGCALT